VVVLSVLVSEVGSSWKAGGLGVSGIMEGSASHAVLSFLVRSSEERAAVRGSLMFAELVVELVESPKSLRLAPA
jgi:hypothetical protein